MTSSSLINFEVNYPWINSSLFEKLLRKDYNSDDVIEVEKYSLEPALKNGENFLSQMIRARVDYRVNGSLNKINFVIKAQLLDEAQSIHQNELFSREIAVFKYVIPYAVELLRRIGDDTKISAKCYEANSEKLYLVFEDLTSRGYRNVDRQIGLSVDNYKSAFLVLAKWHAATAVLVQTDNHPTIRLFDDMFTTTFFENLVKRIIERTAQFIKEFKPDNEKLAVKLEAMSDGIFIKIQESTERVSTEFNCLCHSDLWTNNIMFNDSLPLNSNALLIDFQMVHTASPVLDICYSLFSSSEVSARQNEFDFLLSYYHNHLSSTLKQLGYKNEIPTLDFLKDQMLLRGIYGVPLGIWGTIRRYIEENDISEMDLLTLDGEENKLHWYNLFNNPKCHGKVTFLLDYFDSKGYFDMKGK
ncbi:uncharacterized protein LOC119071531 [Bradysia coprophila]|uniref:uncharacterized protein LOC119071531 n=1 Tax=Bradysia coprophila TaxID=38358 RepID=UPI00187DAA71|nr:uncharacterized protein LOC119071531 [Bradysia coprophila]